MKRLFKNFNLNCGEKRQKDNDNYNMSKQLNTGLGTTQVTITEHAPIYSAERM